MIKNKVDYGTAILRGFEYLLDKYKNVFVIGQGLWSPWYVGNTMTGLDKKYGRERIIDSPVSESATTGAAVGASVVGMRPIVVHPRMDFMLYAMDSIVNQAAKWSNMFGGNASAPVTIRAIINRGGEQGPQHSQAFHSWFANIPGIRVLMPSTVADARDMLISAVLSNDPVLYVDDRWLYDLEDVLPPIKEIDIKEFAPKVTRCGADITIVGVGFTSRLANEVADLLGSEVSVEVIDLRVLNPIDPCKIVDSVLKTGRLLVVDGGWKTCGIAGEVIASVTEKIMPQKLRAMPRRLTLPDAPAPTASNLEKEYYLSVSDIVDAVKEMIYE